MSAASTPPQQIPVRVIGGPTALIEYGGLRFLTDPTFDAPGDYPLGPGLVLTKTAPSSASPEDLGRIDVVLLSHDEHPDNLDHSGRALLADVPVTLTTPSGAGRLGADAKGLEDWESVELDRPDGGTVTVTGVPAIHGPGTREEVEPISGEVVGFVLTAADLATVYVSGDNASLALVKEIGERFGPVDTAVLFAGAPRLPIFDSTVVLDSAQAAEAAQLLGARRVVPVHFDSWAHFTEGRDDLVAAFTAAGLADRLQLN
ncbi:MBL fold metallo-hydrolase [Streptomyces lunaelactis]|uniref:MBL fold metallo-hydrolase n=3 Tax=Streptomyces lunaelactis TaxID=1535768 RepID=UPI001584A275|nr:MBL fold metallo-hydrolase [Streptomyces lunaelactis]NUJ99598.1 MBL fold metallo-hydrolase [Streptomyces lunaelactis]